MKSKYRVYICLYPDCPAMGKKGQSCPTHNAELEGVVVRVVDEEAEAKAAKARETLAKLEKQRGKNLDGSPSFGSLFGTGLGGF